MIQPHYCRYQLARRGFGTMLALGTVIALASPVAAQPLGMASQQEVDPTIASYAPTRDLTGRVTIAGSDTMFPLMKRLVAEFTAMHPNTKFGVEGLGSSRSIREFLLDISFQRRGDKARNVGTDGSAHAELLSSSRPLTEQERKGFAWNHGYEPVEMAIAMDAVAIYVNKDNPIQGLTLDQIDGIFGSSGKRNHAGGSISTWDQTGLKDGWSQRPIHLYGRSKKSGTREFFKHVALLDGELKSDVQEQPGSASQILAVAQDPLSIGYASTGYQTSFVKMVPLAEKAGARFVTPSEESVNDGSYPLARPLYLYIHKDPEEKLDPVVAEFLNFINSRQGQEAVARSNFYPLSSTQIAKNRERLGQSDVVAFETLK